MGSSCSSPRSPSPTRPRSVPSPWTRSPWRRSCSSATEKWPTPPKRRRSRWSSAVRSSTSATSPSSDSGCAQHCSQVSPPARCWPRSCPGPAIRRPPPRRPSRWTPPTGCTWATAARTRRPCCRSGSPSRAWSCASSPWGCCATPNVRSPDWRSPPPSPAPSARWSACRSRAAASSWTWTVWWTTTRCSPTYRSHHAGRTRSACGSTPAQWPAVASSNAWNVPTRSAARTSPGWSSAARSS